MSHRPYIKDDDSGTISDLAIDAETLQGYKPCVNIVTLEDNNSTTAGTWLAKTNKVSALVDGQLFLYKITVAGASTTTLNITGSAGALGAKTVYRVGTSKLTTHYPVGHYILLAYNSSNTCFRVVNDYDANSDTYVRQYQHGKNAAGTTNLYPILTRYNLTNKSGTYDNAYARFYTDTYIDITTGNLYAPKVYSGGSEVAVKTDIPTKSSWNYDDRYVRFDTWDQDLTELQKIQARSNIGAGTSSFSGSYNDLTDKPDECIKTVPMYIDDDDKYIFLWGLKEDTHTLYFLPEGTYYVYARGTNFSDRDGYVGTFFGPATLTIHSMGSSELRYSLYDGYGQGIGYGSVHKYVSTITSDYYEYSPIVKANFEAQTGTIHAPLYIKYTSPTYTDGATYEFAECSLYAGGTNVTLNGTSKSATTASFYAPITAGSSGQLLKSNGSGAPVWVDLATVATSGSYNDLTDTPTIPTETTVTNWGFTKNVGTVTSVRVQAGTGLSSSTSTASTTTLDTTISIASGYKLLTNSEYNTLNAKQDKISVGANGQLLSSNGSSLVWTNDNRGLLHHDLEVIIDNTTTDNGWSMFNPTYNGFLLKSVRFNANSPSWGVGDFGSGIVFGGVDTKGVVSVSYRNPEIKFAGGNGSGPRWWVGLAGTSGITYDLDKLKAKPSRVTGSWTVSTSNPKPMIEIILDHPDIKIYYKTYVANTRRTTIENVLYYADYSETSGAYVLTLRYINSSGNLTTIGSGTVYYEYFE